MEQIRQKMTMLTQHLEEHGDKYLSKRSRKKFLSSAGPGFLVLTFIEDGLRIFLRWGEQHHYMTKRMGMGGFFAGFILLLSAAVQLGGAALILRPDTFRPSRVKSASYMLLGFVALQPFMYGQATDADFMCRSITLAGGFLLLIWSENERVSKAEGMGGLLQGERNEGADRLQLSGRLLLCFLFLFQAIHGEKGGLHSVLTAPSIFNITSSLREQSLAAHAICVVSPSASTPPPSLTCPPPPLQSSSPSR